MFLRLVSLLILVVMTMAPLPARAEINVRAELDRDEMDPSDLVTYTVTVVTDEDVEIDKPVTPQFTGFEVVKSWNEMRANSGIVMTPNGPEFKARVTHIYNYMLQPSRDGRFSFGPAQVTIGGRRFNTKSVSVNVAKGASGNVAKNQNRAQNQNQQPQLPPGFPPDLFDDEDDVFAQLLRRQGVLPPSTGGYKGQPTNPNEAFFVQVEVDRTNVYQDEQVTASWYLYTRGQIRDLDTLKYPALRGFWKEDIEIATQLNFQQEVINGVPYKKALLATFALFPIKPGVSVVDEYKVRCSIFEMDNPFLGNGPIRQYTKTSQPVKINVKALPVEGQPKDFSGAVGTYQVTARVEDPNVIVGEPFALKIRFEGKGNAKRIDLPPINLPDTVELHETQQDAKFFRTGTSYRDFTLLIVPKQEGEITIPSISTSIFDPNTGKYVQASTQPVVVRAARGTGKSTLANKGLGDGKKAAAETEDPEPTIAADFSVGHSLSAGQQMAGFSVLFVLIGLTLLWKARTELGWGQRKRDLNRRLQARFRKVDERVGAADWRGVGVEVTNTVYFVLGEVSGQGGANVELEKLMRQAPPSVRRELSEPVLKLMDSFQALSFAPEQMVTHLRESGQVKKLVSEMQQLMEKAVALGLNAEQDASSSTNPRAS